MDMIPAKIITVLAFGVYVFVGGYMAVVWTDAIQAVLLFGGFVTIAIPVSYTHLDVYKRQVHARETVDGRF